VSERLERRSWDSVLANFPETWLIRELVLPKQRRFDTLEHALLRSIWLQAPALLVPVV
jgi:hypothetical protein